MSSNNLALRGLPAEIAKVLADSSNRAKIGVVGNRKGGTGKTTVCMLVGEGFALLGGKRVLLIDTDRQCNMSTAFGLSEQIPEVPHAFSDTGVRPDELLAPPVHPEWEEGDLFAKRSSSAEVMEENGKPVIPYATYIDDAVEYMQALNPLGGRVDLLPGDGQKLWHIHSHADRYTPRALYLRWAEWLVKSNVLNDYDLILFDTPPFDTAVHEALYQLADHIIVPVQPTNDTLSAATAIAYSCMAAQASDRRPRTVTTIVNPTSNRITKKQQQWLESTVWSNQFLGPLPMGQELPRAPTIADRRDSPIPPYNEADYADLSDDERKQAFQQMSRDIREVHLWHRPTNQYRKRLYSVVNSLCKRMLGNPLPKDPWTKSASKPKSKSKSKATAA